MLVAPPLAEMALKFGPPEYFSLMVLGLTLLAYLSSGPMIKALLMASIGLFLGTIGIDTLTGSARFTFDTITLTPGMARPNVDGSLESEVLSNLVQVT
jgi:putative tricarboxylic transport membrane protein